MRIWNFGLTKNSGLGARVELPICKRLNFEYDFICTTSCKGHIIYGIGVVYQILEDSETYVCADFIKIVQVGFL